MEKFLIPRKIVSSSKSDIPNVLNMTNSIIGVSILAMPWSFSQVGIGMASLLLLIGAIATKMACHLLLSCLDQAYSSTLPNLYPASFEFLALNVLGKRGKLLVELSTIGYLLGVCIAFLVVMGDMMPQMATQLLGLPEDWVSRTTLLILITFGIALPLSLIQRMEMLYSLSAVSVTFYLLFLLKIFYEAFSSESSWNLESLPFWRTSNFLVVLPIFLTGLSCQTQVFVIYDSLERGSSSERMNGIISDSVNFCFVLYWFVGLFGFLAFGEKTNGDILVNFDSSLASNLIKLFYMITVAISFPLCIFPCRRSVDTLIFYSEYSSRPDESSFSEKAGISEPFPGGTFFANRFTVITIGLILIILLAAIFIPNIETILNLSGSTMGSLICFLFPAAIAYKVHSQTNLNKGEIIPVCWVIFTIGVIVGVSCFFHFIFWSNNEVISPAHESPAFK